MFTVEERESIRDRIVQMSREDKRLIAWAPASPSSLEQNQK